MPIEEQRKTAALAGGRIYEFDCGHEMPLRTIAGTVSIMLAHFADAVPPPSMTPCPAPPPWPYHRAQPWPDSRAVWRRRLGRATATSGRAARTSTPRFHGSARAAWAGWYAALLLHPLSQRPASAARVRAGGGGRPAAVGSVSPAGNVLNRVLQGR